MDDKKLIWPAPERNKDPILEVLKKHMPKAGLVLEIASGSGQHAVHFAAAFPDLVWQPSDIEIEHRNSIEAWRDHTVTANIEDPIHLDTRLGGWEQAITGDTTAVICINMIHISPWASCQGLFQGTSALLPPDAPLILYGPFMIDGRHTSASNARFSENLQRQNPAWGVRDLTDVTKVAEDCGFGFVEKYEMPANNLTVVYRKI